MGITHFCTLRAARRANLNFFSDSQIESQMLSNEASNARLRVPLPKCYYVVGNLAEISLKKVDIYVRHGAFGKILKLG